jgi:hypothetical protein
MTDHVGFLRAKAAALRDLTRRAPLIADALRRLADELEARAAELERHNQGPPKQP